MTRARRAPAPKPAPRFDSEIRAELERNMIGGLLCVSPTDPNLAGDVLALCPKGSVVTPDLVWIWDAVCDLHARGEEVDNLSVWDWQQARYMRREASRGPDAYQLAMLMQTLWQSRDHVLHWARLIADTLLRQKLQYLLTEGASDCLAFGEDPGSIASRVRRGLDELLAPDMAPKLGELLEKVVASVEEGRGASPLPSPWDNLNAVLKGGAAPGELVVLAGRPGLGKTALAGCWAVETARRHGPVLFVSCEVRDETLGARLLAREAGIDNRVFRQGLGRASAEGSGVAGNSESAGGAGGAGGGLSAMRGAVDALRDLPLRIVDSSRRSARPADVGRLARSIRGGVALVVVDYLQLMRPDEERESREREIADMSRSMKRLALELNCPVLLLSQLNRKAEEAGREPLLSDLRESGAVEQDADIVIMLHSERRHMAAGRCPVRALVRKGRSSGTGAADLIFDKVHSDFQSAGRSAGRNAGRERGGGDGGSPGDPGDFGTPESFGPDGPWPGWDNAAPVNEF